MQKPMCNEQYSCSFLKAEMALKLSANVIRKRLVEWRNYKRLYPELRRKYEELKEENAQLRRELARERRERQETVEALTLQIEELRQMVFGRKRGDDDNSAPPPGGREAHIRPERKPRPPASYRRSPPKDEEVTQESFHGIEQCPDCGTPLTHLREIVRYLEDIVLPLPDGNPLKTVERLRIETGFCPRCRRWRSALPIARHVSSLGENVRRRIVYCLAILGMTFGKVRCDLQDTFGIVVSDGEIAHVLTTEAAKLLPEYHAIDVRIRGSPCKHLDETGWPVQREGEGQWGWVKTAADSPATIFRLGRSRGKGNAKALHDAPGQRTVTDDYGAYDQLGEDQALCWAHPLRKFRNLAGSAALSGRKQQLCREFHERFRALMTDVRSIVESPYDRVARGREAGRFQGEIAALCATHPHDPPKLATLKATFLAKAERYLPCVREPGVPMTNNKAERSLRPLVLKRKVSFGSKTQKGADVLSILLSVCFTLWWGRPSNFYAAYEATVRKWQVA